MTAREHDVIVIGAGPAGEVACGALAAEGLDVALVERELVGGECAFWACMPSKALLRPGDLLAEDRRVVGLTPGELDVPAILERRDEVIHGLTDDHQLKWLDARGITLYRGQARLAGERRVRAGDDELTARRAVIIASGSGAAMPPVDGLADIHPWTNREATTAEAVPQRLTVLGGGAVGCELSQAWTSLGAQVTLVEYHDVVLHGEEPFASQLLADSLRDQGIELKLGVQAVSAGRSDDGYVALALGTGEELISDELLVAVGRTPHTQDLGLETVDLAPGELIAVDDRMRVPHHEDWLYAIGDVNGRALLTQAGKYQARVATANIMNRHASATWDGPLTPRAVFTEPQVAAVGHTLRQALDAGISARAIDADPDKTPGGSFIGKGAPAGARIVVDDEREIMVGATFVGPEVAEWLHAATFAIVGETPLRRLAEAMPAFPTRSEVWLKLLEDWAP